ERDPVQVTFAEPAYSADLDEFVYNRDIGRAIQVACAAGPTRDWLFKSAPAAARRSAAWSGATARAPPVRPPARPCPAPGEVGRSAGGHLVTAHAGVLDVTRAREQLGFEARFDLASGIADAAAVIRERSEEVVA